jgi:RNA polymerase sigma-70 factor (ECF subfamily)
MSRTDDHGPTNAAVTAPTDFQDRQRLYDEFAPLVCRLLRRYSHSAELREELPGELYDRFNILLDRFDPERGIPLRPYLVRQLSLSIHTFARKRWLQHRREQPLHGDAGVTGSCAGDALRDPTPQWDTMLAQAQILADLPLTIDRLPRRQRQVVILRYCEDRSFEEIAQQLDIQQATARSLLRFGLQNLRKRLAVHSANEA